MKRLNGSAGWICLAALVAAWDLLAGETLSTAFFRAVKCPRKRWPVIIVWGYVTGHLFHAWPDKYDPLRQLHRRVQ